MSTQTGLENCPACGADLKPHCEPSPDRVSTAACDWVKCSKCHAGPFRTSGWIAEGGTPQTKTYHICQFRERNRFGVDERCGIPMLAVLTSDDTLFHWCPRHDYATAS